jgi:hypothetical protein
MLKKKGILLLCMVVLTLSAGVVVGWVWTPLQKVVVATASHNPPRPWFEQLELSSDQHKQMDQIWADTRQQMQKLGGARRDLDHQREAAVEAILTPSQRETFEKINADFAARRNALEKQRDTLISDASVKSRALLDDSQKKKWDELSKDMWRRRGPGGMSTRSTTRPDEDGNGSH